MGGVRKKIRKVIFFFLCVFAQVKGRLTFYLQYILTIPKYASFRFILDYICNLRPDPKFLMQFLSKRKYF